MINKAGRHIPRVIEGYGETLPYGAAISPPQTKAPEVNRPGKVFFSRSLRDSIRRSGLRNRNRISFHHHLRLGDRVVEQVLDELDAMGFRDLILCLSSVMGPAAAAVLKAVDQGVVRRIETTGLKSPLSEALLEGRIPEPVVFRSHGGRARAMEWGEIPVNVAFLAASAADKQGNLTGTEGPNRFGSLGYAQVDAAYADYVIGLCDYVTEAPLTHIGIPHSSVNDLVLLASIGDRTGLSGGSIRSSGRPLEKLIASQAFEVMKAAGILRQGFSYQAGSGGISLLVSRYLKEYLRNVKIKGRFVSGGATADLVEMCRQGLFRTLWDVQSFDDAAALSLAEQDFHKEMSASLYANPFHPGCIAHKLDVMILSATEVDRDFHVNSITGTNGRILGALGGAPDTAQGAGLTMVVMPSFRGRIPSVCRRVRTACTPGDTVDVLVTERGLVVHPRKDALAEKLKKAGLEVLTMDGLIARVEKLTGRPDSLPDGERISGIVEYRDGSVLDLIRQTSGS